MITDTITNFCGPYWHDGKFQSSTANPFLKAKSPFDETCRIHDISYATATSNSDLRAADTKFYEANYGKGLVRSSAALLVRHLNPYTMTKLRGTSKPPAPKQMKHKEPAQTISAPDAIGTIIRPSKPTINRTANGATITGQDFIGVVEGNGVATFGLGKSALLSPAYFVSSFIGNLARSFEKYKWNRLRVIYYPRVSTGLAGQCILASQRSVSEPGLQPESGTFLQRVMTQGNATMGPLWLQNAIDIDCSADWKLLDPATTSDLDDTIHEELQVYTQTATSGQVGYLMAEYSVSFREPIYQPHSSAFPMVTGPGLRCVLTDNAAVNATGDALAFKDSTSPLGIGAANNGSVYRLVFDVQGSSCYTGSTFTSGFSVYLIKHATTVTYANTGNTIPFVGGLTIYGVVSGSLINLYTSIEAAVNGAGTGQMYYNAVSSAAGSYSFDAQLVRYGMTTIASVQ